MSVFATTWSVGISDTSCATTGNNLATTLQDHFGAPVIRYTRALHVYCVNYGRLTTPEVPTTSPADFNVATSCSFLPFMQSVSRNDDLTRMKD